MVFQTGSWPDLRNVRTLLGRMPGFVSFNLSTGVNLNGVALELAAENLFDERGQIYRYAACTTQVCGYEPYILPIKPRLISLTIAEKF